ncbi:MAG: transporter [Ramlibacter sp.]|jgi:predicted lipid-binding transport protein (Tim44 family)|nr:transporter [Ramlibacter sp.]
MKIWTVLLASVLAFGALDADARRLGGGGSMGRQSPNVMQRQAPPPAATPNAPAAQRSPTAAPAPGAAAAPARRPWGGILGGLAAGLGLAWLANALGFGAGFANILMIILLVVVVLGVVAAIRARRQLPAMAGAYGGASGFPGSTAEYPSNPRQYNPMKVGNDASARPWEDATIPAQGTAGGIQIGSGLGGPRGTLDGSQTWGVPPGFDTDGFLNAAKRNFVTLQDAWDRSDVSTLRSMMTDEMLTQIRTQIAERDRQGPLDPSQRTEVEMLEAQLLGIEELDTEYMASVEFSGMIREEPSAGPSPFREVWNMVKPKDGSAGWLVAGVQALQ